MATTAVLHGRRAGGQRATPEPASLELVQGQSMLPTGMRLQDGTDLRQVTILSKSDWGRIQGQLNKRATEEEKLRQATEEREKLHQLCTNQVKNWGNTIAGQRQRKLEAMKLREDKEEEERKLVDIEEAKYTAQARKEAIEKAKTQQYYQTDRVKGFHSALQFTEVLKEREAQLELKRLKAMASDGVDQALSEQAQKDYEKAILKDQQEAKDRIRRARETAGFQKAQVNRHLKHQEREKSEQYHEADELRRLGIVHQMEKERLEMIRLEEEKARMADILQQFDDVKKMKQYEKQQEEDEDDECRLFALAKRKMMKMRAEKEKQLHFEKQEKLDKIRSKLYAQMQQQVDDEDDRINRAEEENNARRAKEEAERDARVRKTYKEMAEHRHAQMLEDEKRKKEERKRDLEIKLIKQQADEVFARNEEEKRKRRFNEQQEISLDHLNRMENRKNKTRAEREEEIAQAQRNFELLKVEEDQFQEYASRVIDHCQKNGRNVYPLRKAATAGAGMGGMPGERTNVPINNVNTAKPGKSGKNLGFVW